MPADALAVHGFTAEFLADKPLFGDVADEFLAFVGDAPLVAHNASFDIAFLIRFAKWGLESLSRRSRVKNWTCSSISWGLLRSRRLATGRRPR